MFALMLINMNGLLILIHGIISLSERKDFE